MSDLCLFKPAQTVVPARKEIEKTIESMVSHVVAAHLGLAEKCCQVPKSDCKYSTPLALDNIVHEIKSSIKVTDEQLKIQAFKKIILQGTNEYKNSLNKPNILVVLNDLVNSEEYFRILRERGKTLGFSDIDKDNIGKGVIYGAVNLTVGNIENINSENIWARIVSKEQYEEILKNTKFKKPPIVIEA